jgi:hypothetical protein
MPEQTQLDLAQAIAPLLTREEFHTVYAIQWVAHSYGAYGASEMNEEERSLTFSFLGLALIFGIHRLHEAGYKFGALRVSDDDGEVFPEAHGEVTSGNIMYIHQLAVGRPLNFLIFVKSAIAFVEEHELDLDLEPLRHAAEEISQMLDFTVENLDPGTAAEIRAAKREVMATGEAISRGGALRLGKITDN